jgi:PAS domain S-box-containing protein
VCFGDEHTRDQPFSEREELFVELLARLVGTTLEREEHERQLEARNERLEREKRQVERIAETSFDVLFQLDSDATFTQVSDAAERILDHEPSELEGSRVGDVLTSDSIEDVLAAHTAVMDGENVEGVEMGIVDSTGERVHLETNATPIREDGEVVGLQGVARDITDRKQRQRELELKDRAMDKAGVGISIADAQQPDQPLLYINDEFTRTTGYEATDAVGFNCRFLQGEATDPETIEEIREALDREEQTTVEILNYRQNGRPFWNRLTVDPVANEDGQITHFLGFQQDVTDTVRTRRLIELLNRVLRHNLRNELNALLGFGSQLDEREHAQTIYAQVRGIVSDLIELSDKARELENLARQDRDPRRHDPDTLLSDLAATYRERFPEATITVEGTSDQDLCAGREIRRAFEELLENALGHTPKGTAVAVRIAERDDVIEVQIRDDGPGIEAIEIRAIEAGDETPLMHGDGIGLWLVNWIVTRYGGSFEIGAGEDGGTVATVRVPAIGPAGAPEEAICPPTVLFR